MRYGYSLAAKAAAIIWQMPIINQENWTYNISQWVERGMDAAPFIFVVIAILEYFFKVTPTVLAVEAAIAIACKIYSPRVRKYNNSLSQKFTKSSK